MSQAFAKKRASRAYQRHIECSYSFDELFEACYRRSMTNDERAGFAALNLPDRNTLLSEWAAKAGWQTKEKVWRDGQTYLAFWK